MGRPGLLAAACCILGVASASAAASPISRPEACRLARLAVSVGPYVSEATEQHTLALRLVNRTQRFCVLDGYPGVTLFDSRGPMRFRIRDGGDQMIASSPPKPVRVRPGGQAFLVLNKNACVGRSLRSATTLELRTASGGATVFNFPAGMPLRWRIPYSCLSADDPGQTITMSPFVPSVRAAIAG